MTMTRIAQVLSGLLAAFLAFASLSTIFDPASLARVGIGSVEDFGITALRTLGAPVLMMSVMSAIALRTQNWRYLVPVAIYALINAVIRIGGLAMDGVHTSTIRGLVLAVVVFLVAEVALQLFRRAEKQASAAE